MTIWEHFKNVFNFFSSEYVSPSIDSRIDDKSKELVAMVEKEIKEDVDSWFVEGGHQPHYSRDGVAYTVYSFSNMSRGIRLDYKTLGHRAHNRLLAVHEKAKALKEATEKEAELDLLKNRMINSIYPYQIGGVYRAPKGESFRLRPCESAELPITVGGCDLFVLCEGRIHHNYYKLVVLHKENKYNLSFHCTDDGMELVSESLEELDQAATLKEFVVNA